MKTIDWSKRDNNGRFVKGSGSYWKGKKFSKTYKEKLSLAHIGKQADEKHPLWKGRKVGYTALHDWVGRKLGVPNKCSNCGTTNSPRFEWANISGKYKRDLKDYWRLCRKCHHRFDQISLKRWGKI